MRQRLNLGWTTIMLNRPMAVENTTEDAQRVILLAVQSGVEYALGHGIDLELIQAAALEAADFLRVFGTPPKCPAPKPSPGFRVVRPPITQLRLPLEDQA